MNEYLEKFSWTPANYVHFLMVCPLKVTLRNNNANTTEAVLPYVQDKTTISFIQTQSILKQ